MDIDPDVVLIDDDANDNEHDNEHANWHVPSMGWKPDQLLRWHLIPGEEIIYRDSPSTSALLIQSLWVLIPPIVIGFFAIVWGLTTGHFLAVGIALIVTGASFLTLLIRRTAAHYTMYVLTTVRVMKLSGVFRLTAYWMPWAKVTDVRLERSISGRLFRFATVVIESANENSGLKEMKNLHDPKTFYLKLTAMVQLKQGNTAADSMVRSLAWD